MVMGNEMLTGSMYAESWGRKQRCAEDALELKVEPTVM